MTHVVAIVPAYNRADTVSATVTALRTIADVLDIIVIDDGSRDRTAAQAAAAGARVIELARNHGKGAAVAAGIAASGAPEIYLLIDADLGASAAHADKLLTPIIAGATDMAIAVFAVDEPGESGTEGVLGVTDESSDSKRRIGGFGLVKRVAVRILRSQTGTTFAEPLSGQRAVRGSLLRSLELADGFGLEIGLTLDAVARGAVVTEVQVPFAHRPTGRDLGGFAHRARIGRHVLNAAAARIGRGRTLLCVLVGGDSDRSVSLLRPRWVIRVRAVLARLFRGVGAVVPCRMGRRLRRRT